MNINNCKVIKLPKIADHRGNLTFVEQSKHIPFDIKRVYWTYDIPAEAKRGGHAHKSLQQLVIALSGSFDVILDDGINRQCVTLNKPSEGLIITSAVWREIENTSGGAVCLVLASELYDKDEYIRDYNEFKKFNNIQC